MSRIFTLSVLFEGKERAALVNLNANEYDMDVRVHYLDRELYSILPEGNLVFSLNEGLKQPHELDTDQAVQLVDNTVDALTAFFSRSKQE
jgi:hypothetical protein